MRIVEAVLAVNENRKRAMGRKVAVWTGQGNRLNGWGTMIVPSATERHRHHGCWFSREVTTKSVRSVPQLEQRNRSSFSGASPRPDSTIAWGSASAVVSATT